MGEWFGVAKVGLELFIEAGPAAFARFQDLGYAVFADLKLHDIPNTVGRAARVLGRAGVDIANFHAAGGIDMMTAAVAGLRDGAAEAGHAPPAAIAVTVLTSEPDARAFPDRLRVTAQLVATASGEILWSDKVDVPAQDLITVQDTLAERVVSGLRLTLTPEEQAGVVRFVYQLDAERKLSGPELSTLAARFVNAEDPVEASRIRETIVRGFYGAARDA